jgi:hypothetical protein
MSNQQTACTQEPSEVRESNVSAPDSIPRIDRKYVHKHQQRNVILARVDRIDGSERLFEAELSPDWTHPNYFDHPCDHVPSMMLLEAGRQMVIALSHKYLDVPFGVAFVVTRLDIRFNDFADIHAKEPVLLRGEVGELKYHRDNLTSMRIDGTFHQGERDVGGMGGDVKLFPRKVYERFRRSRMCKGA